MHTHVRDKVHLATATFSWQTMLLLYKRAITDGNASTWCRQGRWRPPCSPSPRCPSTRLRAEGARTSEQPSRAERFQKQRQNNLSAFENTFKNRNTNRFSLSEHFQRMPDDLGGRQHARGNIKQYDASNKPLYTPSGSTNQQQR